MPYYDNPYELVLAFYLTKWIKQIKKEPKNDPIGKMTLWANNYASYLTFVNGRRAARSFR